MAAGMVADTAEVFTEEEAITGAVFEEVAVTVAEVASIVVAAATAGAP
jgi:hypothetical protein